MAEDKLAAIGLTKQVTTAEFIKIVAEDVYNQFMKSDKEYIEEHPIAIYYLYTTCLAIRNVYIYPYLEKFGFLDEYGHEDSLSVKIMDCIIKKVLAEQE